METAGPMLLPAVLVVLAMVGLVIVLKVLGLAVKVIVAVALFAVVGFGYYLYASGTFG